MAYTSGSFTNKEKHNSGILWFLAAESTMRCCIQFSLRILFPVKKGLRSLRTLDNAHPEASAGLLHGILGGNIGCKRFLGWLGHGVDFRESCEKLCWLRPCRGRCVGSTGHCWLVPLDVT